MLGSILCFGFSPVCLQTTNMQLYSHRKWVHCKLRNFVYYEYKILLSNEPFNFNQKKLPILKLIQIQMNKYYIKLN